MAAVVNQPPGESTSVVNQSVTVVVSCTDIRGDGLSRRAGVGVKSTFVECDPTGPIFRSAD